MSTPYLALNYTQNTAVLRQALTVTQPATFSTSAATSNAFYIQQTGTGQALEVYGGASAGASNVFVVKSGQDSTSATALIVSVSGNVGIGTSAPLQRAHVQGTSFFNGNVGVGAGASNPTRALQVSGDTTLEGATVIGDPIPTGLVASLSFTGHTFEDSGNSNALIGYPEITGTPQINTAGRVGSSLVAINPPGSTPTTFLGYPITVNSLSAAGNSVAARLTHTAASGFTLSAWIKPYGISATNRQFALGAEGGFSPTNVVSSGSYLVALGIEASTNYCVATIQQSAGNYVTVTSVSAATVGAWTHVAMTCSGAGAVGSTGTLTLYVNGTSVGTPQSYTTDNNPFLSKLFLFNAFTTATNAFYGEVDQVQVYSRGLSSTEVASLYANTSARTPALTTSSVRIQGPCQLSPSTALDVFNTNTSNAAMTLQYTTQEYVGIDGSGATYLSSNIADYMNGAVSVSRLGPFPTTLPSEGSFYFDNYSYAGSNTAFLTTPQTTAGSNAYAFNWWQSGGFTAEAWVYQTARPATGYCTILAHADPLSVTAATTYWAFSLNVGVPQFSYYSGSTITVNASTTVPLNTWTHVAVSCDGTNIALYVNGSRETNSALSGTPQVNFTGSVPLLVGQLGGGNAFQGYISNLRLVRGAALYTAASFTVPIAPLPRATVTTPATTLMLLRAVQTQRVPLSLSGDGRLAGITKVGGAQETDPIRAYPPVAMTTNGFAVTASNATYGFGYYNATASSTFNANTQPYLLFDKTSGSTFGTSNLAGYTYSTTSPYGYSGNNRTNDVNGTVYAGEWVQLQMPVSIRLTSITLTSTSGQLTKSPSRFYILGSQDGASWTLVAQYTGITASTTPFTLPVTTRLSFSTYRMVIANLTGNGGVVDFQELLFNGKQEAAVTVVTPDARVGLGGVMNPTQALEVSGNAIISGSLSAANMGMFRNAIINGDMRINQRGTSTNLASMTALGAASNYVVDRWGVYRSAYQTGASMAQGTNLTLADLPFAERGIKTFARVGRVNADSGVNDIYLSYALESQDSYRFLGQPVTISGYYRTGAAFSGTKLTIVVLTGTGTDEGIQRGATITGGVSTNYDLSTTSTWKYFTVTHRMDAAINQIGFALKYTPSGTTSTTNDYFDVTGIQMEKGTIATPFEIRPYGTELQLCQRYAYVVTGGGTLATSVFVGTAICQVSNTHMLSMPIPVPMRAAPLINFTVNNLLSIFFSVHAYIPSANVSSPQYYALGQNVVRLYVTGAGSGSAGYPEELYIGNNVAGSMILSAEL